MKNETILRGLLVFVLLGFFIMTFEYFEKDRVYQELKVSVFNLSFARDNGSYGVSEIIEQIIQSKQNDKEKL
jgi:hypothetical protein